MHINSYLLENIEHHLINSLVESEVVELRLAPRRLLFKTLKFTNPPSQPKQELIQELKIVFRIVIFLWLVWAFRTTP